MSVAPLKRDITKLAKLLDAGGFDSAEHMAEEALKMAFEVYEQRSQFVIVGQLIYANERGFVDNGDKVAFGPYASLGDAKETGPSLALSAQTGEQFKWWMLPYHHGSPFEWFKARKAIAGGDTGVPLTEAEKMIVRYNPDKAHLWGLKPQVGKSDEPDYRPAGRMDQSESAS